MSTACEKVRALLSVRHDGELDAARTRAVDRHLSGCPPCRAELDALDRLSRAAAALREEIPPADLGTRVRAAAGRDGRSPWAARLAAAAALVLATATAYALGLWQGRGAPAGRGADGLVQLVPLPGDGQVAVHRRLPSDDEAVRAARSLFADLALLEAVPRSVRAPLLGAQLAYFGLDRWAQTRGPGDRAGEVAALVRRLDGAVERGVPPAELAVLRESADEPGLWRVPPAAHGRPPGAARDEVDRLVDALAADLERETRRSIGSWIVAKEAWVRGGDDLDSLVQMVDAIGAHMQGAAPTGSTFTLPDLAQLESEIEWTVDPDGTRRGALHLDSSGPDGRRTFHLEVQHREVRLGGDSRR